MPIWNGFQQELLSAAKLPTDEAHQEFLFDWSAHTTSDCANNPVDISRAASGASNCHKLTNSRTAKKYATHSSAADAFSRQIHSGSFPHLLAALQAIDPFQQPDTSAVAADIRKWGSTQFATFYASHSQSGSGAGSGGGGPGAGAPRAHGGWADLRKSVNHHFPTALRRSERNINAALRSLGKAHKVKR